MSTCSRSISYRFYTFWLHLLSNLLFCCNCCCCCCCCSCWCSWCSSFFFLFSFSKYKSGLVFVFRKPNVSTNCTQVLIFILFSASLFLFLSHSLTHSVTYSLTYSLDSLSTSKNTDLKL